MPRHLNPAPRDPFHGFTPVQVALGTSRLLVDIARAELDVTAANLEAAQAAYLAGGAR